MAGTIAGKVTDIRNNMPIANATVSASNGGSGSTTTNDNGDYSLSLDESISPGYNMDVKASGYQEWIAEGIVVINDVTTTINVALMPADQ